MKKYIFYLVTLCICASFLVACSGNDEESDASTEQEEKASSTNDEEETNEEEDKEDDNSINKDEEQKIEGNIIVDNDHRFLYIEGESNLLEGTLLSSKYYSDEDATFYDGFRTEKYVEPDETFLLPIKYDSITQDGYIEIHGIPNSTHHTKDDMFEAYGENFEHLSGDVVTDEDDHQEILLKIDTEGNEMETPEDSLVTENDGEFKIQRPDDVLFDIDNSELKSDSKATLDDVIDVLEDVDDGIVIEINGHTDNEAETEYNLKLSEERAEEVDKYLTKNGDIDHLSIQTNGYGEEEPIESNAEEEGRERNRRVEIVIENLE